MKTTRLPSRVMPPRYDESMGYAAVLFLTALALGFGYFLYSALTFAKCMIAMSCCAACCYGSVVNQREKRRY